jgi:hypothetical protein
MSYGFLSLQLHHKNEKRNTGVEQTFYSGEISPKRNIQNSKIK